MPADDSMGAFKPSYEQRQRMVEQAMANAEPAMGDRDPVTDLSEHPRVDRIAHALTAGTSGLMSYGTAASGPLAWPASALFGVNALVHGHAAMRNHQQIQGRHPAQLEQQYWAKKLREASGE